MAEKREKLVINIDTSPEAIEAAKTKQDARKFLTAEEILNSPDMREYVTHGVKALGVNSQDLSKDITDLEHLLDDSVKTLTDAIRAMSNNFLDTLPSVIDNIVQALFEPYYSILAEKYPEDTPETLRELCIDFNNSIIEKYGINKDYWPGYPLEDITPEEQAALPAFTDQTIKDLLDYAATHIDAIRGARKDVKEPIQDELFSPTYTFGVNGWNYAITRAKYNLPEIVKNSIANKISTVRVGRTNKYTIEVDCRTPDGLPVTAFEYNVMMTIGNMIEAGNTLVSPQTIHNQMMKRTSGGRISSKMKSKINNAMLRANKTLTMINYSGQAAWKTVEEMPEGGHITGGVFIPSTPHAVKKNGAIEYSYTIGILPPFYEYALRTHQLYTAEEKYLIGIGDVLRYTPEHINLRMYLEEQILYRSGSPTNNPLLFADIAKETDNEDCLPVNDSPAEIKRAKDKMYDLREAVLRLLDFYKADKVDSRGRRISQNAPLITDYEILYEGKQIIGIKLYPADGIKRTNKKIRRLKGK
jgi:hypothetical protein